MRRIKALLMVAGLAAMPAIAVAAPPADTRVQTFEWSMGKGRLGVMVMSLTPELRTHFGASGDSGVIVARVEPGTPAEAAGLAVGDVIVEVRDQPIDSAMDVLGALSEVRKGQKAAVEIVRDRRPVTLQVTMADDPAPRMPSRAFGDAWPGPEQFREWMQRVLPPAPGPKRAPRA